MTDPGLVIRIAAKGDGVTADGRHVPMSAPGDRLRADGGLDFGPHHVDPPCRHYPLCGGCQLQHLDEESFAAYVRDRVAGALVGQGVEAGEVLPAHVSPPGSRRRAALRAARFGRKVHLGFSSGNSHRIVDMDMCAVLDPALFALVAPLRDLIGPMLGDRRGCQAKMTLADQGIDLLIEGVEADGLEATERLIAFAQKHRLARLSIDDGFGPQTRYEPEPVTISFGGVAVASPPHAFLQATADGERALVDAVRPALDGVDIWADLFCGMGTFALSLGEGKRVYAAEAARDLVLALKAAANRAQRQVAVDHRDLFRRPLTPEELNRFGAILLDPPRAGAREQVAQLAASTVPVIAYISCNPGSFARDAKTLIESGYRLESVRPVGQFRWSTHVELAGIFRR
ncbi:MAG: class I SAM-dependent RNA methyltransferase [Sphingomonadales bacterium]|nr:MAG: class I SAM-dependent RNA methyltransferase [Sphingomonadales bacterium]TNF01750.1 MAG: class I SAM-dependent RNA methyltransferase [Sphingomonadales bacterium]